jgi:hypothetical protein
MRIVITEKQLNIIKRKLSLEQFKPSMGIDKTRVAKNFEPNPEFDKSSKTNKTSKLPYQTFKNADYNVMVSILNGIGGLVNEETIGFLYAWRQSESSLGSEERYFCNNPFSTTWDSDQKGIKKGSKESTMYTRTNSHGVKSYKTIDVGISSTVKTINRNYPNIIKAVKTPNINCLKMAEIASPDLDKWGSGGNHVKSICKKYLSGSTPNPRPINRGEGCY